MREVKFRAWNVILKRYEYFTLKDLEGKNCIQWHILIIEQFICGEVYEGDICDVWHEDDVYHDEEGEDVVRNDDIRKAVARWGGSDYPAFDLYTREKGNHGKPYWCPVDDELNTFSNDSWQLRVVGNVHNDSHLLDTPEIEGGLRLAPRGATPKGGDDG
jgi:hypothetical protein